jgi:hypothetical protein
VKDNRHLIAFSLDKEFVSGTGKNALLVEQAFFDNWD